MFSISIIVPIYNVEKYVTKCINSIIQQDNCRAQLECILVDDCSPDNSMSIVHSLIDNYQGNIIFVFCEHDQNKGLSAARNTGIDASHGDYILFVDSDDWLPKNSISLFVQKLEKNSDVDMIWGATYYTNDRNTNFNITESSIYNNYQLRKSLFDGLHISCSAWNKLIRTELVRKQRFQEGIIFEDALWSYSIFRYISKAIIIPKVTYYYENNHPMSIVNTSHTKEKASLHINSVCVMGNIILKLPYWDLYVESHLFYFKYLIIALRLQHEHHINTEVIQQLHNLRKRYVMQIYKDGRWFLALFSLLLTYPPITYIFNFSCVRRNYDIIARAARIIANFLELFHKVIR